MNFFLFLVDFPELLSCLCLAKRGLTLFLRQKTLTTYYPKFCLGMPLLGGGGQSVYGHVTAKFCRMGSLPRFLTNGAPRLHGSSNSSSQR